MIGKTISHYRIVEKLGEGGMGVVYKARDLTLDRFVAIKGLPEHLQDRDVEHQRFMREARAASALNHPNVCTIYDFLKWDGKQYIVMEYVEGITLRERLANAPHGTPLPLTEAVSCAIQIAEALEAAHDHKVVHRDVKPANIMITSKNQAKVMDFGLAKLKGAMKLTRTDSTLGTVAYMSPEQMQGGDVDHRSDLFSFGIVLYEMLTGCLPFQGEHEAALMYSIVNEEPQPLQERLPSASAELQRIMDRLLQKNPELRYQGARDVVDDLRRLAALRPESLREPPRGESARRTKRSAAARGYAWRKWWIWIGAAGVGIVALLLSVVPSRMTGVRLNPQRTLRTLKIPSARFSNPALSRDGNWLAYFAADEDGLWDVYVLNIATEESFRVTSEKNTVAFGIDISPDMSEIVYGCLKADRVPQEIRVVSFHGGISRRLADYGIYPLWSPDGRRIGYVHLGISLKFEVWSVNPDGTDNRLECADSLTRIQSGEPLAFCWSFDGASMAWIRNFPQDYGEVMVHDIRRGTDRQLTAERRKIWNLIWTSNDRIIFSMNKAGNTELWAMTPEGNGIVQITQGVFPIFRATASGDCRRLVYDHTETATYLWSSDLQGDNERQVTFDDILVQYAAFAPDKKHIGAIMGDVDWSKLERHLYIMDPAGKNRRKLTSGSQIVQFCAWSPDGSWLAYSSRGIAEAPDSAKVYLMRPFDPGTPILIARGSYIVWIDSENFIVPSTVHESVQYSVRGNEPKRIPCEDSTAAIRMPGRRHFNVVDRRRGREGLWAVPCDSHGTATGSGVRIGPPELFTLHAPDLSYALYEKSGEIWRVSLATGKQERVGRVGAGAAAIIDVSADGKEFLYIKQETRTKLVMVENLFQ